MGIIKKIFGESKIYDDDSSWLPRTLTGKKSKPKIYRIIKSCPGKLHSWVDSSIGIIRKENKNIPSYLFKQSNA